MKNIFVGNLSFGATEDDIRSLFEAYGTVDRVSVATDRETGRARGFGFVEMSNDAEGDKAMSALNGRELDGRTYDEIPARTNVKTPPDDERRAAIAEVLGDMADGG